jgi:hypothetical protein
MSIYAFDKRRFSLPFITYNTEGLFVLEDCILRVAEPLAQWISESNSWNSTFISLDKGTFIFKNTNFGNIGVNTEGSCVIKIILRNEKALRMEGCEFSGGSLDDEGNTIYITSSSVPESTSVNISNSTFRSCYNEKGGVFRCDCFCFCLFVCLLFL